MRRYVFSITVAVDQLVNALLGGYADETVSYRSAVARNRGKRWGCVLCKVLDRLHPNHCDYSILAKHASVLRRLN